MHPHYLQALARTKLDVILHQLSHFLTKFLFMQQLLLQQLQSMPSGGAAGGMDRGGYGAEKSVGYGDSGGYGGGSDRGGYGGGGSREYSHVFLLSPSLYNVSVTLEDSSRRFLLSVASAFQSHTHTFQGKV
jgi:hypothetical protein